MSLIIKKRVDLEFLGEDFKGSHLTFRSIPAKDLPGIVEQSDVDDNIKAIPIIVDVLKKYFVEGKHEDKEVKKEELDELDANGVVKCFQILTGQDTDPKVDGQ